MLDLWVSYPVPNFLRISLLQRPTGRFILNALLIYWSVFLLGFGGSFLSHEIGGKKLLLLASALCRSICKFSCTRLCGESVFMDHKPVELSPRRCRPTPVGYASTTAQPRGDRHQAWCEHLASPSMLRFWEMLAHVPEITESCRVLLHSATGAFLFMTN